MAVIRPALLAPAVAMTLAPRWAASWTSSPPVTPPAPFTSTVCPACTCRAPAIVWSAVSAGTGSAAAASNDTPGGTAAACSAAAMNCSAQAPCSRSGSECTVTRSPARIPSARSPAAATSPAASTPSAIGGRMPRSQPPVRANSSQLPTPHACTSSKTSSGRNARGPGTSSSSIAAPIRRIPAALMAADGGLRGRQAGVGDQSPYVVGDAADLLGCGVLADRDDDRKAVIQGFLHQFVEGERELVVPVAGDGEFERRGIGLVVAVGEIGGTGAGHRGSFGRPPVGSPAGSVWPVLELVSPRRGTSHPGKTLAGTCALPPAGSGAQVELSFRRGQIRTRRRHARPRRRGHPLPRRRHPRRLLLCCRLP